MSFRRKRNADDQWLDYCRNQQAALRSTGLPAELFRRADLAASFLQNGTLRSADGGEVSLSEMPDTAFLALEGFVNGWFDFQDRFPAFKQERLKRFRRYG